MASALLLPATASAAPCPGPSPPEYPRIPAEPFLLQAPRQIAVERSSYARLVSYPTVGVAYSAASFDYLAPDGSVIESRVLTSRQLAEISDVESLARTGSYPVLRFPIRWLADRRGIRLRFSATIHPIGLPPCELSVRRSVAFISGLSPRPVLRSSNLLSSDGPFEFHWTLTLELGTRCERLKPGRFRLTLAHRGRVRVMGPRRRCSGSYYGNWNWARRGDIIPGLRAETSFAALELYPIGARPRSRTFRLDLAWNGRRLIRAWVRTTVGKRHRARRVFRGGEAFDVCAEIRPGLVHTDAAGRHYCTLPAWTDQTIQLFCRRPRREDQRNVLNRAFFCPDRALRGSFLAS